MYISTALLFLAASGTQANAIVAKREPLSNLAARDVSQGWSLQSSSALADAHSCGNGAYCPVSLHCNPAANHEVAACCSDTSDCRGSVEGSPKCADSSWNLWIGYDGNGFCCLGGLVGVYDVTKSVAGTCVSSDNVGSSRTAVLTSTGTGAQATAAASSSSTSSPAAAAAPTTTSTSGSSTSSTSSGSTTTSTAVTPASNGTSTATTSSASTTASANAAQPMAQGLGLMGALFFALAAF